MLNLFLNMLMINIYNKINNKKIYIKNQKWMNLFF